LLEKLQTKLMMNDQKLQDIDSNRKELTRICQEEQGKISALCAGVQARVAASGEALKEKTKTEYAKLDKELASTRESLRSDSLMLCPELEKITELAGKGEESTFDVEKSWRKVKDIISRSQYDESFHHRPTIHPSKTLAKVKTSDLGYLCVAQYLPHQYQLVLTSPMSNLMVASVTNKAICTVTTNQEFTEKIQANIKFSIKNKECKETVPYCKEECKLSENKKSFQICFLVQKPGVYMVTVLLYDQHVTDSPLMLMVSDEEMVTEKNEQPIIPSENIVMKEEPFTQLKCPSPRIQSLKQSATVTDGKMPNAVSVPTTTFESSLAPSPVASIERSSPPTTNSKVTPTSLITTNSNSSLPLPTPTSRQPPSTSTLPPGPLTLSHILSGGKLTGLRVLSIEEGAKPESLHKPIGMCLLQNGNIVVASTFEDKVKMFSPTGKFLSLVTSPESPFERPSDMVTLQSGQFVVRDNTRVQVFSPTGTHMRTLWQDKGQDKCYGLAQDKEGRLVTIMETRRQKKTDLLFFDLETGKLARKIEMEDIIADRSRSKCRFLTYQLGKLYITDLGLDCVYILDPATISVKVFGSTGSGLGQLSDPAGLVVDTVGNMIVADSKNHRLCLYDTEGKFICNLTLSPEARRPSGVVLDKENKELYVLTLQGRVAMTKYKLK